MWRWTAGAAAAALFVFGLFEYLNTLPVTNGELLFLRTRHPYLVGQAMAHILRGSLSRAVMAGLLAALMLAVLWMIAASVGRIATVRALLDYFRRDAADRVSAGVVPSDGEGDVASNASTDGIPTHRLGRGCHFWIHGRGDPGGLRLTGGRPAARAGVSSLRASGGIDLLRMVGTQLVIVAGGSVCRSQ
jgi:hypothetical protein